ncbi:hypothetical protein My1_081 [Pectobacterium phage My1]|uniref:Uncharacterized protein n=1 Tax=Pectobacterium phage My1 TaxID=1204539 RepID=J9QGR3_9CAUD|nr:hypothetical protein My1_081 [Pectobacterium phage My1]AFQ22240.1 hypothetical protein My1_081 [Pectobacterium phage My1]
MPISKKPRKSSSKESVEVAVRKGQVQLAGMRKIYTLLSRATNGLVKPLDY